MLKVPACVKGPIVVFALPRTSALTSGAPDSLDLSGVPFFHCPLKILCSAVAWLIRSSLSPFLMVTVVERNVAVPMYTLGFCGIVLASITRQAEKRTVKSASPKRPNQIFLCISVPLNPPCEFCVSPQDCHEKY